jgi:ankyrin repeat protein
MVRFLLESGAAVNAKNALGNTPLHLSVADKRVVEVLLGAGAQVNARNGLDKTPLHYAIRQGTSTYNLSIVETLILAGAKRGARPGVPGQGCPARGARPGVPGQGYAAIRLWDPGRD